MRRTFVQVKKYKGKLGVKHLEHVLRIKTTRELTGEKEVVSEFDLNLYRPESDRRVWYFEVVAYCQGEERDRVLAYLRERFSRPVMAVTHFDEAHPHTHFLIPWYYDKRALRFKIGDFLRISSEVARLLGQRIVRDQGRDAIPLRRYFANPVAARKEIEAFTTWRDDTLRQLEEVIRFYKGIRIVLYSNGKRIEFDEYDCWEEVPIKRLKKLNDDGVEICFENVFEWSFLVGRVPKGCLERGLIGRSLVIRVGDTYEWHVNLEEVYRTLGLDVVEALVKLMRLRFNVLVCRGHLPGFSVWGSEAVIFRGWRELEIADKVFEELLIKAKELIEYEREYDEKVKRTRQKLGIDLDLYWTDFFSGDYSEADLKFMRYLILSGLDKERVFEVFRSESKYLNVRFEDEKAIRQYFEGLVSLEK